MQINTGGKGSRSVIDALLDDIRVPRMVKVRQNFLHPPAIDVAQGLSAQLAQPRHWQNFKRGDSVAIAVGSRGIINQVEAVQVIVQAIKTRGGKPFIIPAMGSHAGATAEGQKAMLEGLGFTEERVGAPIRSSMETVLLGHAGEEKLPILTDKIGFGADHMILINRVKPHVCFRGVYESGLMKMISIGLGKQQGAEIAHNLGFGRMAEHIEQIALGALQHLKILFAVALVENAFHETCMAVAMPSAEIPSQEARLLELAKEYSARLHFDQLDALIIDEIGKDISGSGFDTNIVGRYHSEWLSGGPKITRLGILDISAASKGNGNGLGMADFTTIRAVEKFDFAQTYPNTLTALLTGGVKIPMVLKNDRQIFQACMKMSHHANWEEATFVRIKNTLEMHTIEVSENLAKKLSADPRFEILSEPYELTFDSHGNLF